MPDHRLPPAVFGAPAALTQPQAPPARTERPPPRTRVRPTLAACQSRPSPVSPGVGTASGKPTCPARPSAYLLGQAPRAPDPVLCPAHRPLPSPAPPPPRSKLSRTRPSRPLGQSELRHAGGGGAWTPARGAQVPEKCARAAGPRMSGWAVRARRAGSPAGSPGRTTSAGFPRRRRPPLPGRSQAVPGDGSGPRPGCGARGLGEARAAEGLPNFATCGGLLAPLSNPAVNKPNKNQQRFIYFQLFIVATVQYTLQGPVSWRQQQQAVPPGPPCAWGAGRKLQASPLRKACPAFHPPALHVTPPRLLPGPPNPDVIPISGTAPRILRPSRRCILAAGVQLKLSPPQRVPCLHPPPRPVSLFCEAVLPPRSHRITHWLHTPGLRRPPRLGAHWLGGGHPVHPSSPQWRPVPGT